MNREADKTNELLQQRLMLVEQRLTDHQWMVSHLGELLALAADLRDSLGSRHRLTRHYQAALATYESWVARDTRLREQLTGRLGLASGASKTD